MRGVLALSVVFVCWLILRPAQAAPPAPVYVVATAVPPTAVTQPASVQQPTRIVVPALGLDAPVIPSPIDVTPAAAVGWWNEPGRGDTVLFGHNYGVFAPLANVQAEQAVGVEYGGVMAWYTVTGTETRPADGYVPDAVPGQVLLITCLPFPAGDTERLIVYAR